MSDKKMIKNEKGFTLIEIIAVIIIMGILAAVAVPKFFSMQEDAKRASIDGALSEAAARFNHAFSKYILNIKSAPKDVDGYLNTAEYLGTDAITCTVGATAAAAGGTTIGDFKVCWTKDGTDLKIIVTYAETFKDALFTTPEADRTKVIVGVDWGS